MNAAEQLVLFEPKGVELAALALQALRTSKRCESVAAVCQDMAIVRHYRADALAQMERAVVFDTCYEFETLAGLV